MVLDNLITSPHLRSPSFRKQFPRDDLGSWSTLLQRHRFLLTALVLLAFLCTIYLYFAVTLGATESCSGFTGTKRALCHMELAKDSCNFRDFNIEHDPYSNESIELLERQGIDLKKNSEKGIDSSDFALMVLSSGLNLVSMFTPEDLRD
ncbi:hypothetical protein OIU76_003526 [Salix suchowensis]|nr:hypothetical protein OIU76_003526 [Salix suchowensis]